MKGENVISPSKRRNHQFSPKGAVTALQIYRNNMIVPGMHELNTWWFTWVLGAVVPRPFRIGKFGGSTPQPPKDPLLLYLRYDSLL